MIIENTKQYKLSEEAMCCLSLIIGVNNQLVKRLNIQDVEVDLIVNITRVNIFHNMMVFYGDYHSLLYVKNLIIDTIKEQHEGCIKESDKYDVRVTGSGYITHSVAHYSALSQ